MIENTGATHILDNEALFTLAGESTDLEALNTIAAKAYAGATAPFRFGGDLISDPEKLKAALISDPRKHFLSIGHSPLDGGDYNVADLTAKIFDASNTLTHGDPKNGKYLSAAAIFRGATPQEEIDENL